ncbi:hypothetical protein ABPG74_005788 [Tetrahymena malaccensis]
MEIQTKNIQKEVRVHRQDELSYILHRYAIEIGLLGLISYKFYRSAPLYFKWKKCENCLRGIKNVAANDLNSNQIVYCSGQLKFDSSKIIQDELFGVSSQQNLGLYRKIEVFKTLGKQQKQDWYNLNYLKQEQIPKEVKALQSQVLTSSNVFVEDYQISNSLLQTLAEANSKQISLNKEVILKYSENLRQQLQGVDNIKQNGNSSPGYSEQQLSQIKLLCQNHPFKLSEESQKMIEIYDNSIFIVTTLEEISEGDIKISYYDINKIENVTVLGQKQDNLITDFQVPELAKENEIIEIQVEDNTFHFKVGQIGFAFKGNLTESQVQREFEAAVAEYTISETAILALLAFLYCYIVDQFFGDFKFSHSEEEMREVAKKMIQKVNDTEINVNHKEKRIFFTCFQALVLCVIHVEAQKNLIRGIHILPSTVALICGGAYFLIEMKKVIEFSQILEQEIKQQQSELQEKLLSISQNQQE